ncbi:hypothetical protein WICMUC_002449 [Wickerhamomyces mucosus]|uniref:C2H2-type domain-containing protein n=1 Tax=Wickerhamomyces mucosus TaxID=1378264 RepID=A0A9P8PQX3_9ASCO|nr:hypothetical protein WICMUC_002449 [Wickerhamomyces mucosus]
MVDKGSFGRRTWDRVEYAELARRRKEASKRDEDFGTSNAKKAKITSGNFDFTKDLNKRTIITGNVTQTRGKTFGFYCDVCDLTFKDNLKFIDHLNSKPHLIKANELGKFDQKKEISLDDVKRRYDLLIRKLDEMDKEDYSSSFNVKKRIEYKKQIELKKREHAVEKGKDKHSNNDGETNGEIMAAIGFRGFGTSKK